MSPLIHFLTSAIVCILLFPIYGWDALFIMVGGVLIDVDHYLLYIGIFKNISLTKAHKYYKWVYENKKYKKGDFLGIFHTIEFLFLFVVLSYFSIVFFLITIGILVHYILDIIFEMIFVKNIIKVQSILVWIKDNRKDLSGFFSKHKRYYNQ